LERLVNIVTFLCALNKISCLLNAMVARRFTVPRIQDLMIINVNCLQILKVSTW